MHEVEPDGLELQRRRRDELRIDWHEEILAADLHAVTGVEEHADIGPLQCDCEVAYPSVEGRLVQVIALEDFVTMLLQCGSHIGCVSLWIGQLVSVDICRVADHQRD